MLYLLLAHLIADFVLQPEQLVKWKSSSWQGIFAHGLIHFSIMVVLLAPYIVGSPDAAPLFYGIFAISGAHFVIDTVKLHFEAKSKDFSLYFFADQLTHLLVILGVGLYLQNATELTVNSAYFGSWYTNAALPLALCLLIIVTKAYELALYQIKRKKNPKAKFRPDWAAMGRRAIIWAVAYGVFLLFGLYTTAANGL